MSRHVANSAQDLHGDHDHGEAGGHSHAPVVTTSNERRLLLVFGLTFGYALIQAAGGWLSGSLALIADSGHMISDAAALLLALIAYRIARINSPVEVLAGPMLIVAVIGLLVNIIGAWTLWSGNRNDGNLRGALLHVVGDLLGSVAAIAAAIGIMLTGWTILDPLLSILVALLVVRSAWGLVTDSIRVLLQAAPRGLNAQAVEIELTGLPGVYEAGHFHAWTLIHVTPKPGTDALTLPPLVAAWLKEHYRIEHVTVQVDPPGCLVQATH